MNPQANRSGTLRPTKPRLSALRTAGLIVVALAGVARADGPGIKLGDTLVLHPSIYVGAGYDNNVLYGSNTPNVDPTLSSAYVATRPGIELATRSLLGAGTDPRTADFRLTVGLPLRFFATSDKAINGHYSVGVDAGLALAVFPLGNWTFELFDNFIRTSDPPYAVVAALFTLDQGGNINRDLNTGGVRLRWRPGGRRFETAVQYTNGVDYFESQALIDKRLVTHDFNLRFKWNFFPKTALYINGSETLVRYMNQGVGNTPPDGYPLRVIAGLIGLITAKFRVDANIGYGNSFTQSNAAYPNNNSFSSVVASVDLNWAPVTTTQIGVTYKHDFMQALVGTYYTLDVANLRFAQKIWRFNLGLSGGYEHRIYNGSLAADGLKDGRIDNLVNGHIQLDLPIKDWLMVSVGDDVQKLWSNCQFLVQGLHGSPSCDYLRNDLWLRLNVAY